MTPTFTPSESFDQVFLLKEIDERRTKTNKPYLALVLGTKDGTWEGRLWDMELASLPGLTQGDPVRAAGAAQLYQDRIQLIVENMEGVEENVDPRLLYPSTEASEEQLRSGFDELVAGLEDEPLRSLLERMREDRAILDGFFRSPAAISMHHARIGGLAEHSISVCRLARSMAASAPWLDRDLLTAGALLHDIGKVLEYEVAGDFRYTKEGKLIGHIVQGCFLVRGWIDRIEGFPERRAMDVQHIILSHHGQLEHGSPKTPATAEALTIHYADDLDAKLDMVRTAGQDPETEEAFVRGLRRSFLFREGGFEGGTSPGPAPGGRPEGGRGARRVDGAPDAGKAPGIGGAERSGAGRPGGGDGKKKGGGGGQEELF